MATRSSDGICVRRPTSKRKDSKPPVTPTLPSSLSLTKTSLTATRGQRPFNRLACRAIRIFFGGRSVQIAFEATARRPIQHQLRQMTPEATNSLRLPSHLGAACRSWDAPIVTIHNQARCYQTARRHLRRSIVLVPAGRAAIGPMEETRRNASSNANLTAKFAGDCRTQSTSQSVGAQRRNAMPIAAGATARSAFLS